MIPQPEPQPDAPSHSSIESASRLHALLTGHLRRPIACAESCTGGLIAHRITANAGSSDYFQGSAVTYSNAAKQSILWVPQDVLDRVGAVSGECAAAMAEGALRAFDVELAVSTTGIAGPGGATTRKPVGLVYIAVASACGTTVRECRFAGDRAAIIEQATVTALTMLLDHIQPTSPVETDTSHVPLRRPD